MRHGYRAECCLTNVFLKVKPLAERAIKALKAGDISFTPSQQKTSTYQLS
jgi:valyl-tRNA synthetase